MIPYPQELLDAIERDAMDEARWREIDLADEREQRLADALEACKQAGVSEEHLKVLAFETGALRWALEASIKREKTWFKDGEF